MRAGVRKENVRRSISIPERRISLTPTAGAPPDRGTESALLPAAYRQNPQPEGGLPMRRRRTAVGIAATCVLAAGALAVAAEAANPTVNITEKEWTIKRSSPVLTLVHGKHYTIAVHNTG